MQKIVRTFIFILLAAFVCYAQPTGFTYLGTLKNGALPANGSFDFQFDLYDSVNSTDPLDTIQISGVQVVNGIFKVDLDFGNRFPGSERWLGIAVKAGGSQNYTVLTPKLQISSSPYSIKSLESATAATAENALNLGGVTAGSFVQTTDPRLADSREPIAGSSNYIQNAPNQQPSSNFNISGNGTVGGTLSSGSLNVTGNGSVNGTLTANAVSASTQFNIGVDRMLARGTASVFAGRLAGVSFVSGSGNSYFGDAAGRFTANGSNNSFFGRDAGTVTTADDNSFFGAFAGDSNTTGHSNSFFGFSAGGANITGIQNSYFGFEAGLANLAAPGNAAFGYKAGRLNTTPGNSFFGSLSGTDNMGGSENSFFGFETGKANVGGSRNSFYGYSSGSATIEGSRNSYFGARTGLANIAGNDNAFFGNAAGTLNVGSKNSFFGSEAGSINSFGVNNTYVGFEAGAYTSHGRENTYIGTQAGQSFSNGSNYARSNAFLGYRSGFNTRTANPASTDSSFNTFIGSESGFFNETGRLNTYIGDSSGYASVSGSLNTYVGYNSGVGFGNATAGGSYNTSLGAYTSTDSARYGTAIGARARVETDDTIVIGKMAGDWGDGERPADTVVIHGKLVVYSMAAGGLTPICRNPQSELSNCSSSLRYKSNIETYRSGLEVVKGLRPITFNWKEGGLADVGFGAEDVNEVEPLLVTYNKNGEIEGVKYAQISAVLVNAIKEQQLQLENQEKRLRRQQEEINQLKRLLCTKRTSEEVSKTTENKRP